MKRVVTTGLFVCLLLGLTGTAWAQMMPRQDAIWARNTAGQTLTLDGNLNEAAWAKAEMHEIVFGQSAGLPASGFFPEGGLGATPGDTMRATVRFLVDGNYLYMGAVVQDSSVGGGPDFNRKDGFLMDIWWKTMEGHGRRQAELFYAWWFPDNTQPDDSVGISPNFIGDFGVWPPVPGTRTPEQIAAWDAVTVVDGLANTDATLDKGYTVEMRFDLTKFGYTPTDANGEVVPFNISIYDADWLWPLDVNHFSSNRTWWQDPWGNADVGSKVRIFTRPDVTIDTAELPAIAPDAVIPVAGAGVPDPTIDGRLDEAVWNDVNPLRITFGNADLRAGYSGIGPMASSQFQPELGGIRADVVDPGDFFVRWFVKGDKLYLGVDANDQVVVGNDNLDLWDGIRFTIDDRQAPSTNGALVTRDLSVYFDAQGNLGLAGYMPVLVSDTVQAAQVAYTLKGATTINDNTDVDEGYQMELVIDLKALGYPEGLGDRVLFMGVTGFDADLFDDPAANYGTRTWWYRERPDAPAAAWVYVDPTVTVAAERPTEVPAEMTLLGNYPNPFNPATTLRYSLPAAGEVSVVVYDLVGREIRTLRAGLQSAGTQQVRFDATGLASGLYLYRVELRAGGSVVRSELGRMMLVK